MTEPDNNTEEEAEIPEEVKVQREEEGGFVSRLREFLSRFNPLPSEPEREEGRVERDLSVGSLSVGITGTKLDSYSVGQAEVFISEKEGTGHYQIAEPPLSSEEKEVYRELLQDFFYSLKLEESEKPMKYVEGAIWDSAYELGLLSEVRESFSKYQYYLKRDVLGYEQFQVPLEDPKIEEISVAGPNEPARVIHQDYTDLGWLVTNVEFESEMELRNYNEKLAQKLGESLTAAAPIVDATTEKGHRASLTYGQEVTYPGSTLTIRKHPREPLTLPFLVGNGTLSSKMAAYLWQILEWRGYLNVIGPIGSGKTTLLNAVLGSVNPNTKRITIEETPEIRLPSKNWQSMHTRTAHFAMGKEYEVALFDLVKSAMRHRPDYLSVGESRGREMRALTHAASLGHSSVSTFHSDSPESALTRMRAEPIDLSDGEILLIWCLPLTKQTTLSTGEVVRRVHEIKEVVPTKEGEPELKELFTYDKRGDSFSPDSFDKIVDNSVRLQDVGDLRGLEKEEIVEKLKEKAELLEDCVDKGETDFEEYTERVRDYYT